MEILQISVNDLWIIDLVFILEEIGVNPYFLLLNAK